MFISHYDDFALHRVCLAKGTKGYEIISHRTESASETEKESNEDIKVCGSVTDNEKKNHKKAHFFEFFKLGKKGFLLSWKTRKEDENN